MAAILASDVLAECTDLQSVSTLWLTWVNAKVNGDTYDGEDGITTKLVRIYLVAHFSLIGTLLGGASGPVIGETEGGISRQYAAPNMSASALNATAYGRSALQLIRMYVAGAWIADPDA